MDKIKEIWDTFAKKHPTAAQFLVFFLVSNGVTVLQMLLMPMIKSLFGMTPLQGFYKDPIYRFFQNIMGGAV